MLTAKQHELLLFIDDRLKASGISPSFDEMREALDLKSKSGVHRLISALEERGFIRRLPNRARALEVVKLPETRPSATVTPIRPVVTGTGQRHDGNPAARPDRRRNADRGSSRAPKPSRSRRPCSARASIMRSKCPGDSMVDEGILDGDFALIRKVDTAREGEIVVALIDNEEATLKTFRREGSMVRLDPANRNYEPQRYDPRRVQIQGRLAGLIRRY